MACFVVKDHHGKGWRTSISRRSPADSQRPVSDEAPRIAADIAKLPELVGKQ